MALDIVLEFLIDKSNMATVFMSPSPYFELFEGILDLRKFNITKHRNPGQCLAHQNGCLFLGGMAPSTPGAEIPCWCTCIIGAWLIEIGNKLVYTINDARQAFHTLSTNGTMTVTLLFLHSKTHDGLPIVSSIPFHQYIHEQMNHQWDSTTVAEHHRNDVRNCVTKVMKITCRKLLCQEDWSDWQNSKFLQLDQHHAQIMFGEPTPASDRDATFYLVWMYTIKAVDGHKKA
jgi:hypothetical protein